MIGGAVNGEVVSSLSSSSWWSLQRRDDMHNTKGLHLAQKLWASAESQARDEMLFVAFWKKTNLSHLLKHEFPLQLQWAFGFSYLWVGDSVVPERCEPPNSPLALFCHKTQFNVKLEQESRGWYEEDSCFCRMLICTLLWLMRSQNNKEHQTCWRRNMLLRSCWLRSPSYWNLKAQSIVGKAGHCSQTWKIKNPESD